ncbi:MAG TPA: hypothetical protein VER76_13690, partial [Pyrinomonadaceae bacterium]|nr:hypothetical protein [Pyrinomonadaceae bacterium]
INGLKLYATFLRKRMEKTDRPPDELETINKIMAGLERAATDMNMLVRLGRPLELQRQPRLDLAQLLASATEGHFAAADENGAYKGDFDPAVLSDALKNIHAGALSLAGRDAAVQINLRREEAGQGAAAAATEPSALIEWRGVKPVSGDADVFSSFQGGTGLRLAVAARIIHAHDGAVEQASDTLRVRLPLRNDEGGTQDAE